MTNFLLGSARSIFLLFLTLASLIWILRTYNWASWLAKSIFLLSIDFSSFWKSNHAVRFFQTFGTSRRNNKPIFTLFFGITTTIFRGCITGICMFGWAWSSSIWAWLSCYSSIDYSLAMSRTNRLIKSFVRLIDHNPMAFQPANTFFSFKPRCYTLE